MIIIISTYKLLNTHKDLREDECMPASFAVRLKAFPVERKEDAEENNNKKFIWK